MRDVPVFDHAFREQLDSLFRWRRDVRRFRPDPLPAGAREALVATACLAPSVGLSQPWRFVFVSDEARRRAIRASFEHCNAEALRSQDESRASLYARLKLHGLDVAPCQFALFADHSSTRGHGLGRLTMPETIDYSAVLALHTLWLAARASGLGLGWVSILDPSDVRAAVDVPEEWRLVGYFCLGFPESDDDVPDLCRQGWEALIDPAATIIER